MPFTFHSHSGEFCHHAKGNLEEVIQKAIELKFDTIGLSEHVPRFESEFLYPEEKHMEPKDLDNTFKKYLERAKYLRNKYKNSINILIGAELEYINSEHCDRLYDYLETQDIDYFVGSVHHVNDIPIDFDQSTFDQALKSCNNSLEELHLKYFDDQYELIKKFQPKIIGHFDLIRLFSNNKDNFSNLVLEKIIRNINFIINYGGIFEINTRSLKKSLPYPYPQPDVLKLILDHGGKVTLSDDSHGPADVGMYYERVLDYLDLMKVEKIYYLHFNLDGKVEDKVYDNVKDWLKSQNQS